MRIAVEHRSISASTRQRVYGLLREAIVTAELEPGRKLSENELSDLLGVSRTPVREALIRLEDERLVAIVPQLGTFVTLISSAAVGDAAFVREALEAAAVRLATERADHETLAALQANLVAQGRAQDETDVEAFDRLDEDLHRTLCLASGHGIAWDLSRRANGHLERIRRLSLAEPAYLAEMVEEHRAIVAAVGAGDPDAAELTMRRHLRAVPSLEEQLRLEHPTYFADG